MVYGTLFVCSLLDIKPLVPKLLNIAGLVFGLVGSLLLWRFGLPADVNRKGESVLLLEETDHAEIARGKRYDFWGNIGIVLLVIAFALQLVAALL